MKLDTGHGSNPSTASEAAFRAQLTELGAVLIGEYQNMRIPVMVRCADGHEVMRRPSNIMTGYGCRVCAKMDPATSEIAFRARLAELGAELLEPYRGSSRPHHVLCPSQHNCYPRPANITSGQGICRICAGQDSATSEASFRAHLSELGATLLEPYKTALKPHRVQCVAGHECRPTPNSVQQGRGICLACSGHDPVMSEAAFRLRLAELGATIVGLYKTALTPVNVRCANGHDCSPTPASVQQGNGICRACAGLDPEMTAVKFRARLSELGATLIEPAWLGAFAPHRVRCASGHECRPRPRNVMSGQGICTVCAGKTWDVFYLVIDPERYRLKFGITSGDPRPRLSRHRAAGYREVERLMTGLPGSYAPDLERSVLAALKLAGVMPVKGREYHDLSALALVLDVVDEGRWTP